MSRRSGENERHLARCGYLLLTVTIMWTRVRGKHLAHTHITRRAVVTPPSLHLVALGATCVDLTMCPLIWLPGSGHIYLALTVTLGWFLNSGTSTLSQCCQSNQPFKENQANVFTPKKADWWDFCSAKRKPKPNLWLKTKPEPTNRWQQQYEDLAECHHRHTRTTPSS